MPMQFGPITRIPYFLALSRILSSKAFPAGPVSLKPADTIITPFTFARPHSSITSGTVFAGVAIITKSTGSGISSTDL